MSSSNHSLNHRANKCPCGSGLTFRECCLLVESMEAVADAFSIAYSRPASLEFDRFAQHQYQNGQFDHIPSYFRAA